jgi:hypothetical protein
VSSSQSQLYLHFDDVFLIGLHNGTEPGDHRGLYAGNTTAVEFPPDVADNATILVTTGLGVPHTNISYGTPAHRRITFFAAGNVTLHMGGGFWSLQHENVLEQIVRADDSVIRSAHVFPAAATGQLRHSVVLQIGEYAIYTKVNGAGVLPSSSSAGAPTLPRSPIPQRSDDDEASRWQAIAKGGASCATDTDCSLTGSCTSDLICKCDTAWTGPSCEHLHLLPAYRTALYPAGGHPTSLPSSRPFPWGGTIAKEGQVYHLFVAEWANHCPMTYATWPAQVNVRHATSKSPHGPWNPQEIVLTGAGNPVLTRAPDGTHLLFFTGVPQPFSRCAAQRNCSIGSTNSTPPVWSGNQCPGYSSRTSHGQKYHGGDGINLAHSRSLDGPWEIVLDVATQNADTTNPGPVVLPNGTVLLAFKAGSTYGFRSELCPSASGHCESLGVVAAPSWDAFPYADQAFLHGTSIDKKFIGGGGCLEDPSNMYIDNVRGAVHMLFHQGNPNASSASRSDGGDRGGKMPWGCKHPELGTGIPASNSSCGYGGAAHSADGTSWMYSSPSWQGLGWKEGTRSAVAYTYEVAMRDGSTISCIRREEPKLLLGDDNQPEALITQCSMMPMGESPPDANGHSYGTQWSTQLVMQPIHTDGSRSAELTTPRLKTDEAFDADLKSVDDVAAATLRATNHNQAMRSRDIAMRRKRADAHRAGAASLVLEEAMIPSQLRSRCSQTRGSPKSAPGIVDASVFADPTGATDAAPGLREAIAELLTGSHLGRHFSLWSNVTDLSGRRLELGGGEYLLQSPLSIPGGFGNFQISGGTLRAGSLFPADGSLLSLGDDTGAHIESVSLTSMLLHGGGGLVRGSLLNVTYGVGISVGPAVYFEGFSGVGIQVNRGAETLIHECWFVGQYGPGLPFYGKPPARPAPDITLFNSTAIQINGNDHYVSDVIIWQYTHLGVQVNGGGNLLSGVHAWGCGAAWCDPDWYRDLGLSSKSITGIEINAARNRVLGCYLDLNYLDLRSPITDVVVSNSFFLGTSTRLISTGLDGSGEDTGRIWGLTMVGNSLNHIELVGKWNTTDARASISESNIPTSGLGFSPGRRRGSQMTTIHRSISTGLSNGLQNFFFNFSDPGKSNSQDTLLLPEISYLQYSVVFLSGEQRTQHSIHSPGDGTGTAVSVIFDRAVKAIVHVEARCCTGTIADVEAKSLKTDDALLRVSALRSSAYQHDAGGEGGPDPLQLRHTMKKNGVTEPKYYVVGDGFCRGSSDADFVNGRVRCGIPSESACTSGCNAKDACVGYSWAPVFNNRCVLYGEDLDEWLEAAQEPVSTDEWQADSHPNAAIASSSKTLGVVCKTKDTPTTVHIELSDPLSTIRALRELQAGETDAAAGIGMVPSVTNCDACLSVVEQFHLQWVRYIAKQTADKDGAVTKNAQYQQPVIEYNDEVKAMVDGICASQVYRSENLADHVTEACKLMIGDDATKRQLLASFLGRESGPGSLVPKKFAQCRVACPSNESGNYGFGGMSAAGASRCALCHAVVDDALFEIRRKRHDRHLGRWSRAGMFPALDELCDASVMRHTAEAAGPVAEVCDIVVADISAVVDAVVAHKGQPGVVKAEVCGEIVSACARDDFKKTTTKQQKKKKPKKPKKQKQQDNTKTVKGEL